jgi:hypothetical protein
MPDANVDLGDVNTAIQSDGSIAFTADQSMGNNKLTDVEDPTNAQDAATKNYVDTQVGADRIARAVFAGAESASGSNVTGFLIPMGYDSFDAHVLVQVDATTDLTQVVTIKGFFDGTNWILAESYHGDDTLVDFSMNASGQLLYSSSIYAGFVSLTITFKVDLI